MSFSVIIPARYASSRLPGKPLRLIGDKTMIQWVYESAQKSDASRIIVATDDQRIVGAVEQFGGEVCLTSEHHVSGTDRLTEVVTTLGFDDDEIVVNVQGDEPLLPAEVINQLARNLARDTSVAAATLCEPIKLSEEVFNPNIVKVVRDNKNIALYFSRAPIPWDRETFSDVTASIAQEYPIYRHIGLYAYRVRVLKQFSQWPMAVLEQVEKLEQLRLLENGQAIHVEPACESVPGGVDTEQDLERIIDYITNSQA